MMRCQFLGQSSPLAQCLHRLRCSACRSARAADAVVSRGIERLRAEPAPADGLARALAEFGMLPLAPPKVRRRRARLNLRMAPAGAVTALAMAGAAGWLTYIDTDPKVTVPAPSIPYQNGYDLMAAAVAAIPASEKSGAHSGQEYTDYSHSKLNFAFAQTAPDWHAPQITKHQYTMADKEALVRDYAPALTLVRKSFSFNCRIPQVRSLDAPIPLLSDSRQFARALALESQVRAARGDYAGAVNSDMDAIELGALMARGGLLVDRQVGVACATIGGNGMWGLITHLDAKQSRTAARRMEHVLKLQVPFADTLVEEKWRITAGLQETFHERGWRSTLGKLGSGQSPAACYLGLLLYNKRSILARYTREMDGVIAAARRPYRVHVAVAAAPEDILYEPISGFMVPESHYARFRGAAGPDTQNALLTTALALRAYALEHHRPARSLKDLVPAYLMAVPGDPFGCGEPLRYKRFALAGRGAHRAPGHYPRLYSVGPDGLDDSGSAIWERARILADDYGITPESKGDIVAGVNTFVRMNRWTDVRYETTNSF